MLSVAVQLNTRKRKWFRIMQALLNRIPTFGKKPVFVIAITILAFATLAVAWCSSNSGKPLASNSRSIEFGMLVAGLGATHHSSYLPDVDSHITGEALEEYGAVRAVRIPYSTTQQLRWIDGPTTLEFIADGNAVSIYQDGQLLSRTPAAAIDARAWTSLKSVTFGQGAYGRLQAKGISGQALQSGRSLEMMN